MYKRQDVALPTLPASEWLDQVRALVAAENRAREEATVCAVYREALATELEGVFSGDSPGMLGMLSPFTRPGLCPTNHVTAL